MRAFTADSATLRPALSLALNALDTNPALEAHHYALLQSDMDLHLTVNGQHRSITVTVEALCSDESVEACVPVKRLHDLLRMIDGLVTVKQQGEAVRLTTGAATHDLLTLPAYRFTALQPATDHRVTVPGPLLVAMLEAALSAAETNRFGEDRWKALELSAKDGLLTITGCCGPFLVSAAAQIPTSDFYALLPLKGAELIQAVAKQADELTIALSPNLLTISTPIAAASVQLASLPWPDWKQLTAEYYQHTIQVNSPLTLPALRRAMLACQLYDTRIDPRTEITLSANLATFMCRGQGESREQVVIQGNGELKLAVDGQKLGRFLQLVKGMATWQISDGMPIRLSAPNGQFQLQALLMPLVT
jgi:DNA polymerase III sliding clamp (beta) subunit (PCNA family)